MVQTVNSETLSTGQQKILIEKPHTLCRIFFSIRALAPPDAWCESWLSFDDPTFYSYYILAGHLKYFETKGEGIFQGNVWVRNISGTDVVYTAAETLI